MAEVTLSGKAQDYLKAIYCLEREADGVTITRLAERLGVTLPSVTSMIRKLALQRLVSYTPYLSVGLTHAGERQALEIVRHHRLLESYLQKALGYPLEMLHGDADRLGGGIGGACDRRRGRG